MWKVVGSDAVGAAFVFSYALARPGQDAKLDEAWEFLRRGECVAEDSRVLTGRINADPSSAGYAATQLECRERSRMRREGCWISIAL